MTSRGMDSILLEAKCFEGSPFFCEASVLFIQKYKRTSRDFRMTSPRMEPILLEAKCFEASPFLCEDRVQIVTYY